MRKKGEKDRTHKQLDFFSIFPSSLIIGVKRITTSSSHHGRKNRKYDHQNADGNHGPDERGRFERVAKVWRRRGFSGVGADEQCVFFFCFFFSRVKEGSSFFLTTKSRRMPRCSARSETRLTDGFSAIAVHKFVDVKTKKSKEVRVRSSEIREPQSRDRFRRFVFSFFSS